MRGLAHPVIARVAAVAARPIARLVDVDAGAGGRRAGPEPAPATVADRREQRDAAFGGECRRDILRMTGPMLESPSAVDLGKLGHGRMLGQDAIERRDRIGFRIGLERGAQLAPQRAKALDVPTGDPVRELGVTDPAQEADEDLRPVDLLRVRRERVPGVEDLDRTVEVIRRGGSWQRLPPLAARV